MVRAKYRIARLLAGFGTGHHRKSNPAKQMSDQEGINVLISAFKSNYKWFLEKEPHGIVVKIVKKHDPVMYQSLVTKWKNGK